MITLTTETISLRFDLSIGMIADFTVADDGAISPLHRAPWVDDIPAMVEDIAPHLARLGGDFFCAPFGAEAEGSSLHGWPPNSKWALESATASMLRARLERSVSGAVLIKELILRDEHPFVYQRHSFIGGQGSIPVANHANLSLPHGGLISASQKAIWLTPDQPPEDDPQRGRSGLIYPASSPHPDRFPAQQGTVDLTRYPWLPAHEDFVVAVEGGHADLGWTAVTRPAEQDLFLSLRRPTQLPITMLWHSNGGRDYPPWSGRHFGCLGIEEGAAIEILGSRIPPKLRGPGAISLVPNGQTTVDHVIGAIRWPSGDLVESISHHAGELTVTGSTGVSRQIPFDHQFLGL